MWSCDRFFVEHSDVLRKLSKAPESPLRVAHSGFHLGAGPIESADMSCAGAYKAYGSELVELKPIAMVSCGLGTALSCLPTCAMLSTGPLGIDHKSSMESARRSPPRGVMSWPSQPVAVSLCVARPGEKCSVFERWELPAGSLLR